MEPLLVLTFFGSRDPDGGQIETTGASLRSTVLSREQAIELVPQLLALTILNASSVIDLTGIEGL